MRSRILIAVVLLAATGCYSYVPTAIDAAPIGKGVRVYLSRAGMDRLREMGGNEIPGGALTEAVVKGTLVRRDATQFTLQIPVTSRRVGFLQSELGQQVTLPQADVVQVELKNLSGVRTGAALVASTAVIAAVIVSIIKGARQPIDTPTPEPGDIRLPGFSVSVP